MADESSSRSEESDPLTGWPSAPEGWLDRARYALPPLSLGSVLAAVLVLAVVGWFGFQFVVDRGSVPSVDPVLPMSTPLPVDAPEPADGPVVVHVAGAVAAPGVYELAPGSRWIDALAAAGGALDDADLGRLNLAGLAADGAQIYVPVAGEVLPAPLAGTTSGADTGGPVDVNTADATLLESLPGVGPTTAAAIVGHRDEHGPFRAIDDLLAVPGIGPAKLEALRDAAVAQ